MKNPIVLIAVCVLLAAGCSRSGTQNPLLQRGDSAEDRVVKTAFQVQEAPDGHAIVATDLKSDDKRQQPVHWQAETKRKAPPLEFMMYLLTLKR